MVACYNVEYVLDSEMRELTSSAKPSQAQAQPARPGQAGHRQSSKHPDQPSKRAPVIKTKPSKTRTQKTNPAQLEAQAPSSSQCPRCTNVELRTKRQWHCGQPSRLTAKLPPCDIVARMEGFQPIYPSDIDAHTFQGQLSMECPTTYAAYTDVDVRVCLTFGLFFACTCLDHDPHCHTSNLKKCYLTFGLFLNHKSTPKGSEREPLLTKTLKYQTSNAARNTRPDQILLAGQSTSKGQKPNKSTSCQQQQEYRLSGSCNEAGIQTRSHPPGVFFL